MKILLVMKFLALKTGMLSSFYTVCHIKPAVKWARRVKLPFLSMFNYTLGPCNSTISIIHPSFLHDRCVKLQSGYGGELN